jgi:hypothetical protein
MRGRSWFSNRDAECAAAGNATYQKIRFARNYFIDISKNLKDSSAALRAAVTFRAARQVIRDPSTSSGQGGRDEG